MALIFEVKHCPISLVLHLKVEALLFQPNRELKHLGDLLFDVLVEDFVALVIDFKLYHVFFDDCVHIVRFFVDLVLLLHLFLFVGLFLFVDLLIRFALVLDLSFHLG